MLFEQDIVAPEDKQITVTFRAHLPKGRPNLQVYNEVPGPSNLPRSGRHGDTPFVSTKLGRIPWQLKLTDEAGKARYPFLILDSITWRGPIVTDEELARRKSFLPAEDGNLEQVRAGFARLARLAFRRPVSDEEVDHFVGIVKSELAAKEKFREDLCEAETAIFSKTLGTHVQRLATIAHGDGVCTTYIPLVKGK